MQRELNDTEIREGLRRNDGQVFDYLFEKLYVPVCYFVDSIIHDNAGAEDIVVTSFIRFWERRNNFESYDKIKNFIYTDCKNQCFNRLKLAKRYKRRIERWSRTEDDDYPPVEAKIVEAEVLNEIRIAAKLLPEKYRVVYDLYVSGKTIPEIAHQLGISENLASQQKRRAIQQIKEMIKI